MNARAEKELLELGFKKLREHSYRLELSGIAFNVDTKIKKVRSNRSYVILATNGIDLTASTSLDYEFFDTSLATTTMSIDEYGDVTIPLLMRSVKDELIRYVKRACRDYHSYKPVVKMLEDVKLPELPPAEKTKPQTQLF